MGTLLIITHRWSAKAHSIDLSGTRRLLTMLVAAMAMLLMAAALLRMATGSGATTAMTA